MVVAAATPPYCHIVLLRCHIQMHHHDVMIVFTPKNEEGLGF